jgi:hypothetical protein
VPFVSTGSRIEYDDTVIEIAISYVNLVCFRIDFGIRRTAKTRNVIAVGLSPRFSDLQDECPSARELSDTVRHCSFPTKRAAKGNESGLLFEGIGPFASQWQWQLLL